MVQAGTAEGEGFSNIKTAGARASVHATSSGKRASAHATASGPMSGLLKTPTAGSWKGSERSHAHMGSHVRSEFGLARTSTKSPAYLDKLRERREAAAAGGNRMALRYAGTHEAEDDEWLGEYEDLTGLRKIVSSIILSQWFEKLVGFVILANFANIVLETNQRVQSNLTSGGPTQENREILQMINTVNNVFLSFYTCECLSRLYIQQSLFFHFKWNIFDMVIVIFGVLGVILDAIAAGSDSLENMQMLRSIRMIRLLRASRLLMSFPELYTLVYGLMSCMKTLVWAAGLVCFMLTFWSIVALEFVQPLMGSLEEEFQETNCEWCITAFDNIGRANLALFQIITLDSWSSLCRPLMIKYPATSVLFLLLIFTMVFGVLNLITAVIVDTAARARDDDIVNVVHWKEQQREESEKNILEMCKELDEDESGDISVVELKQGAENIPELQAQLKHMGIEEEHIDMLFDILDVDGNGSVSHEEFAKQLHKLKAQELHTSMFFLMHQLRVLRQQIDKVDVHTTQGVELLLHASRGDMPPPKTIVEEASAKNDPNEAHDEVDVLDQEPPPAKNGQGSKSKTWKKMSGSIGKVSAAFGKKNRGAASSPISNTILKAHANAHPRNQQAQSWDLTTSSARDFTPSSHSAEFVASHSAPPPGQASSEPSKGSSHRAGHESLHLFQHMTVAEHHEDPYGGSESADRPSLPGFT